MAISKCEIVSALRCDRQEMPETFVRNLQLWNEFQNVVKEEEEMTNAEKIEFDALKKRVATLEKKYHLWTELPSWASKPIRALYDAHLFSGRSPADLDLTDDMMRMLVVLASALKNQGKLIY